VTRHEAPTSPVGVPIGDAPRAGASARDGRRGRGRCRAPARGSRARAARIGSASWSDHLERHVATATGPSPYPWRRAPGAAATTCPRRTIEATTLARRLDELDSRARQRSVGLGSTSPRADRARAHTARRPSPDQRARAAESISATPSRRAAPSGTLALLCRAARGGVGGIGARPAGQHAQRPRDDATRGMTRGRWSPVADNGAGKRAGESRWASSPAACSRRGSGIVDATSVAGAGWRVRAPPGDPRGKCSGCRDAGIPDSPSRCARRLSGPRCGPTRPRSRRIRLDSTPTSSPVAARSSAATTSRPIAACSSRPPVSGRFAPRSAYSRTSEIRNAT